MNQSLTQQLRAQIQRAQHQVQQFEERLEELDEQGYDRIRDSLEALEDQEREYVDLGDPTGAGSRQILCQMEFALGRLQKAFNDLAPKASSMLEPAEDAVESIEDTLRELGRQPSDFVALYIQREQQAAIFEFEASLEVGQAAAQAAEEFDLEGSETWGLLTFEEEELELTQSLREVGLSSCTTLTLAPTSATLDLGPYTIIVNARSSQVEGPDVSWAQIVEIAYPHAAQGPRIEYTILYTQGPQANPSGSLLEGQAVQLEEEMVFNVRRTDRS